MGVFAEAVEQRYYTEVWRKYLYAKALDDVPRSGIAVCGTGRVQPKTAEERRVRLERIRVLQAELADLGVVRLETDGGHTYGLCLFAWLFHQYFPDWMSDEVYALLAPAALHHELGERKYGDWPDDGTRNADEKFCQEYAVVKEFYCGIPDADVRLLHIWRLAEHMKGMPYESIKNYGSIRLAAWWLKALDKTEAVLQNGRYKALGVVGHIGQKDDASEQDLRAVRELGTDEITFIWAHASAGYVRGTPLWKLIVAMLLDLYNEDEIPSQFLSPDI